MMRKLYSRLFILSILLGKAIIAEAQETKLQQITPKSPNIASFEKFLDVPVGLGTGTVNLNVPIYEIEVGNLRIPITLSYNNNGLKCDDIPSWVGQGWNLSTGGYISYQQRGLNDFTSQFGLFQYGLTPLNRFYSNQMSESEKKNYFEDIIEGNVDSEFDQFFYNFSGNSGSFHFIDPNTARSNPKVDLKISKTQLGFKIIDTDGNAFFFESQESISVVNTQSVSPNFSDNSAYYVTKIITADQKVVDFTYKSYSLTYTKVSASISFTAPACSEYGQPNWASSLTTINYLLPDEIIFPSGSVKFDHSTSIRTDLQQIDPNTTARFLKGISVFNVSGKIKEFRFDHSYFGSGSRLRLDSIAIVDNGQTLKDWHFDYFMSDGFFPSIFSKSKDHWGYYNGKFSSNNLPRANYSTFVAYFNNSIVPDANRTSDFNFAKAGMIKSVTYPTGGKTEFEYEQNQFVVNSYSDFPFQPFLETEDNNSYTVLVSGGNATTGNLLTGSFTIPQGGGFYKFNSWRILSPDPFYNGPEIIFSDGDYVSRNLLNSMVNQCNFPLGQCTFSDIIFLKGGTYNYSIQGSYYQNSEGSTYYLYAGFDLMAKPLSAVKAYPVGGGRISRVSSSSAAGEAPLVKKYLYNDSLVHVSFKSAPFYISKKDLQKPGNGGAAGLYCVPCGDLTTIWEESVSPMVGPVIEYGIVSELIDEQGYFGRTEKYLGFSENIGGSNTPPIVTPFNTGWTSGIPIKEKIFKNGSNQPELEVSYNYFSDYLSSQVHGLKVDYDRFCNVDAGATTYSIAPSTIYSATFKPTSTTRKEYTSSGVLINDETYSYNLDKHQNAESITSVNSDYSEIKRKAKFVFDYENLGSASGNASSGLQLLRTANMNLPIEELKIKKIGSVDFIIGGTMKIYKSNQTLINELYILQLIEPIPLSSFQVSMVNTSGAFIMDSRYILSTKFVVYDPSTYNLLEKQQADGVKTSYIWSYNNQYPIAEITNADYASIVAIVGSSAMESLGNQNPDRTTIDNFLLPLKTALPNAYFTSFVYEPLVGMTSQTDVKGMTTYYEYDGFQRLKSIKNQNGDIVKSYCYNYAGQATDCGGGSNTLANWVNTGLNSECQTQPDPFYGNQEAVTGTLLIEQIDNNPNSASYNTTRKIADASAQPGSCPPNYYFTTETDPYLSSVSFNAKRSYDDGTSKTMRFRVRHDSIYYPWGITETFVDIAISSAEGGTGYNYIIVNAAAYLEVELVDVF